MKRRIAKLVAPRRFEFFEEDIPVLADDQILIQTRYAGLCHSDLPPFLGSGCTGLNRHGYHVMLSKIPYPLALGHEPIGLILDAGRKVKRFKPGDLVAGMIPEAFATHIVTTCESTVKVDPDPAKIPLAEPLMCVANMARIAQPEFGDSVAVIGAGFMGLLVIMALKNANLRDLVAIDLQDARLEMAKKYGATRIINPLREDLEDAAFQATGGAMFDVVVEISGSLRGLDSALSIVRLADRVGPRGRGKILLSSVYGKPEQWSPAAGWNLMLRAPVLHSSHPRYCIDLLETMERAVAMYEKGVLRVEELISHRIPFDEIQRGFEILERGETTYTKGVITFE